MAINFAEVEKSIFGSECDPVHFAVLCITERSTKVSWVSSAQERIIKFVRFISTKNACSFMLTTT